MPCNTCVDEKRCDRAGLCQDFAHAVLDSRKPARPDCFDRAMDFLGDPEATALLRYIEALERVARVAPTGEGEQP